MQLTTGICTTLLVTTIAWSSVVKAENAPPRGSFRDSSGYSIDLGSGGDYLGYDRSKRRLAIPHSRGRSSDNTAEWNHNGYIYRVTGMADAVAKPKVTMINADNAYKSMEYPKVSLTIIDPSGRIILFKILNNPNYGKKSG